MYAVEIHATSRRPGRTAMVTPPILGAVAVHVDRVPAVETHPVDNAIEMQFALMRRATPHGMAMTPYDNCSPNSVDKQAYLSIYMLHHDDNDELVVPNGADATMQGNDEDDKDEVQSGLRVMRCHAP